MRELTSLEKARRKRFLYEIQTLLPRGDFLKIDLFKNSPVCNENCAAVIERWHAWITDYFLGTYPARQFQGLPGPDRGGFENPGGLVVPAIALAILEIPSNYDEYLKRIGPKSRNMLRKVERKGFSFNTFDWDDYLDDIYQINTSMAERGGLAMTSEYILFPPKLKPEPIRGCDVHTVQCYGCFHGETLVAYCVIHICGELGVVRNILGHGDYLKDGIMNGLIGFVVRECLCRGVPRYINYLTLHSRTRELDGFKKRVGFASKVVFVQEMPRRRSGRFGLVGRVFEPLLRIFRNLGSRFR